MARQRLYGKMVGTVDDLTFYKGKARKGSEFLVRDKGGVSAERIATDPNFQRTRENNSDFGYSAKWVKGMIDVIRPAIKFATDPQYFSRLVELIRRNLESDTTNVRGMRKVQWTALVTEILGHNFGKTSVESVAFLKVTDAAGTNEHTVTVPAHNALTQIKSPVGATHYRFLTAMAYQTDNTTSEFTGSAVVTGAYQSVNSGTVAAETLTISGLPGAIDSQVLVVGIQFFQLVGTTYYPLTNKSYSACTVLSAAAA
jgi:hypothetical protein